jgi:hypothetical protein
MRGTAGPVFQESSMNFKVFNHVVSPETVEKPKNHIYSVPKCLILL